MTKIMFDGQREGEEVQFVFRRHFVTAKRGIWFLFVMMMVGAVPLLIWQNDVRMLSLFFGFVVIGMMGFLYAYMIWYFSIYIVTNMRIRQIRQKGIFKKTVVDLGLNKIQNISYGITGIFGGILGYGTISIQTGAGDLVISAVSKPALIYEKLQNMILDRKR